jgi:hypothetical protein
VYADELPEFTAKTTPPLELPDWVTVKVCPATVKTPVRDELPGLVATV